jgi:ABC-2 type transport system ATP-binding protein
MTMSEALVVRDARKSFGGTEALRGAGFALRRGELLGLLGPNGAGKTTLVRAIAGRVRLDGGTVELLGRPLAADTSHGDLGVVPQEIALYPLLTARENLDVFGRLHGLAGAPLRDKVGWALEWTALGDRADEPVKAFSGGMKRRLNIACGLLHEPKVVLLDEPTVGVDPQSRERIYEMLDVLRRAGVSLLLTTHHLEEAQARCDRIVVIDRGQAIAEGTVTELIARHLGTTRRLTLTVDPPPASALEGFEWTPGTATLQAPIADVAADLPRLLRSVSERGLAIRDIDVRQHSLQAVFLHLTGKELRE